MLGFRKNSKLVERKEEVPGFNSKNKTDRKILLYVLVSLGIVVALVTICVFLYYYFKI